MTLQGVTLSSRFRMYKVELWVRRLYLYCFRDSFLGCLWLCTLIKLCYYHLLCTYFLQKCLLVLSGLLLLPCRLYFYPYILLYRHFRPHQRLFLRFPFLLHLQGKEQILLRFLRLSPLCHS